MRWTAFALLLSALTATGQVPLPGRGPNLYSREKEVSLGAQLAQQIQRTSTLSTNAAVLAYVQQLGAKLAAQLPEPRYTYTFVVLASGNADAPQEPLALPGGPIFIPEVLFSTAQDDSEFAGILAHAMAHVAARHGTRTATMGAIGDLAVEPIVFNGGFAGFGARQAQGVLIPVALVRFSRAFEQEADTLALTMASAAGYDPEGLVRYIQREAPDNSQVRLASMQTTIKKLHPPSDDFLRIQRQLRNPPQN